MKCIATLRSHYLPKNSSFLTTKFNVDRFRANYARNCASYRKHQENSGKQVSTNRTNDWPAEFQSIHVMILRQNFEKSILNFQKNDNEFCWELEFKNCHIFKITKKLTFLFSFCTHFHFCSRAEPLLSVICLIFLNLFSGFSTYSTKNEEAVSHINFPN